MQFTLMEFSPRPGKIASLNFLSSVLMAYLAGRKNTKISISACLT